MNPLNLIITIFDKLIRLMSYKNSAYLLGMDRRQSFIYKKKQEIVKNIWSIALIIIAISLQYPPTAVFVFVISIITTFLSFMILDETVEKRVDKQKNK